MNGGLPGIARLTFVVHLVVSLVVGVLMLFVPTSFGGWLGYPAAPVELEAPLRGFGAMLLGMGALTSLYGLLTKSWERVDYIVRGEITFTFILTIVFLLSALQGGAPAVANWVFTVISAVLFVLFVITWFARPK